MWLSRQPVRPFDSVNLFFIDKYDTEEKGKAASMKAWYNKLKVALSMCKYDRW